MTSTRRPSSGSDPKKTATKNQAAKKTATKKQATKNQATKKTATKKQRSDSGATGRRLARARLDGRSAEWLVVLPVAMLCLLGIVMVYSASSAGSVADGHASWAVAVKQIGYVVVGVGVAMFVARLPLSFLRDRVAVILYVVALGCLAFVLMPNNPLAVSVNGATRWLGFGPLQFQPSEIAKPALVLWLARYLDMRSKDLSDPYTLRPVLIGFGALAGFVMLGHDLGTTILLALVMLTMLYLAGTPGKYVGSIGGVGALLGVSAIVFLDGFRLKRIAAFLHPEEYRLSEAWQLHQSQIGLASGGLFGSGPGYSRAKWGYLGPEAHTDFILAVIGEELGLFGSLVVISCVVLVMVGGAKIAAGAKDQFGRLVAIGVTAWLGFQALINIGVTVGTLPTKGITLPFVSYGGSSLIVSLAGVGLLLAVARDR